jgi:hypothetical protein
VAVFLYRQSLNKHKEEKVDKAIIDCVHAIKTHALVKGNGQGVSVSIDKPGLRVTARAECHYGDCDDITVYYGATNQYFRLYPRNGKVIIPWETEQSEMVELLNELSTKIKNLN